MCLRCHNFQEIEFFYLLWPTRSLHRSATGNHSLLSDLKSSTIIKSAHPYFISGNIMERRVIYLLVYGLQVPAERLVFEKQVAILCFMQSHVFIWPFSILKKCCWCWPIYADFLKYAKWSRLNVTVMWSFAVSISSIAEWLISEVPAGGEIGFDPFLFSLGEFLFSYRPSSPSLKCSAESRGKHWWGVFTCHWFTSACVIIRRFLH